MEQGQNKRGSRPIHWTVVEAADHHEEQLMVAMQPGVDVPAAVEVVVVESGSDLTEEDIQAVLDPNTGQLVTVAAVEEVEEEDLEEPEHEFPGDEKTEKIGNYKAAKADVDDTESQSSSASGFASHSDEDTEDEPPRKKPKARAFAHRLQWSNTAMMEAMKHIQDKKMSIRGAAKQFGVPYSTLKDRVHGRVKHGTKPGVKTALSPEEEEDLVNYVHDMEDAGFHISCTDVRDRAGEILRLNHGHKSPYKDCSPGHNWFAGFLKRHRGLEFKKTSNRTGSPGFQKQKQLVKSFYETTALAYKKRRMTNKADRVFTLTNMNINIFQDAMVLVAASAEGNAIPPFIIFKGHRLKTTSARQAYPEACFACSYDGSVNEDVLLWWFRDHFLKVIAGTPRPCILFLSRPVSEITFQLAQLAKEEKISLVCIPQGVSHLLQPVDVRLCKSMESLLIRKARKWEEENPGTPFTQKVFAQILKKTWKKGFDPKAIVHRFAQTGLYPLNNHAISSEKISTANRIQKELEEEAERTGTPYSGLSLLSALSSHEYASMEHVCTGSTKSDTSPPARSARTATYSKDTEACMEEAFVPGATRAKAGRSDQRMVVKLPTSPRRTSARLEQKAAKIMPDQVEHTEVVETTEVNMVSENPEETGTLEQQKKSGAETFVWKLSADVVKSVLGETVETTVDIVTDDKQDTENSDEKTKLIDIVPLSGVESMSDAECSVSEVVVGGDLVTGEVSQQEMVPQEVVEEEVVQSDMMQDQEEIKTIIFARPTDTKTVFVSCDGTKRVIVPGEAANTVYLCGDQQIVILPETQAMRDAVVGNIMEQIEEVAGNVKTEPSNKN